MKNRENWRDKSILVTGAGGFIGSHLCESLVNAGSKVKAFIRYNSSNSNGLIDVLPGAVSKNIQIFTGDLLDEDSLSVAVRGSDIIFHLAAIPSIPYSFQNAKHVFNVNTYGTINLLMAAKSAGVKRVILASSAGASEKRPLLSPYITSKAAMEKIGIGFNQGLELNVTIIRLMNNFGPRQSARAVIPTIITQALVRDEVHLGALDPRMDFIYVGDTVSAMLLITDREDSAGKTLTWGTGINTSIQEVAQMIFEIIGRKGLHIIQDKNRIRSVTGPGASLNDEIFDTHAMMKAIPKISLQQGLKLTIDWFRQNPESIKQTHITFK